MKLIEVNTISILYSVPVEQMVQDLLVVDQSQQLLPRREKNRKGEGGRGKGGGGRWQ